MTTIVKTFEDDIELNLIVDETHQFLLPTKEVALGYGVNSDVIRQHKSNNKDELIESKHFVIGENLSREKISQLDISANNLNKTIFWTKRGLVRLGFFIKSQRAKKFRDWCEDLIIAELNKTYEPKIVKEIPIDEDMMKFYSQYGVFNPNAEFYIEHMGFKALAYADSKYGFIVSTPELARLMGVKSSTLRVLKKYHGDKLVKNKHFVKIGHVTWWTRIGAGWIGLHNRDGSFGQYLLSGELDKKLDMESQYLDMESMALLDRVAELSGKEII